MLENKVKVFVRAYNAARSVIDSKIGTAAYRPLNSSGSFDAKELEEIDSILGDINREE
jgi:flagellar capping protein FliD